MLALLVRPCGHSSERHSLALRVAAVAAEVAAGGVLQLAVALGAFADERVVAAGLDAVRDADLYLRLLDCLLLVGEPARRVGLALEAAAREHDALGDRLLRRSQQPLVEPDRVRARHLVERPGHLARVEAAAQQLRG